MNTAQRSPFANAFLLVLALLVLAGGIVGYYFLEEQPTFLRMLALIAAFVVALAIAYNTQQGRSLFDFLRASDLERRKIVWPTRTETIQTTLIIGAVTIVLSIILSLMDLAFASLIKILIGGV